jgi:hypothetical protein
MESQMKTKNYVPDGHPGASGPHISPPQPEPAEMNSTNLEPIDHNFLNSIERIIGHAVTLYTGGGYQSKERDQLQATLNNLISVHIERAIAYREPEEDDY